MIDPRLHNYYEKLLRFIEQNQVPRERVTEIDIWHDLWCRIYRGGYCNCDPEVKFRPPPEQN
jgi:hypothetical protein